MRNHFFIYILLVAFVFTACSEEEVQQEQIDQKQLPKKDLNWETVFETSDGTKTVTYQEGIAYYKKLAKHFDQFHLLNFGTTDAGKPLHLGVLSPEGSYLPSNFKTKNVLLINNAIHPGEPDGVEASMMLVRDILEKKVDFELKNTIIAIIPFYNIGGALNRNTGTRANQDGPEEYGFRGNAQNLDLNRDFIKMDSKNMWAFAEIFRLTKPDLFIDTHVSNGADYQYTLTYLASHEDKLGVVGEFVRDKMNPYMEQAMDKDGYPIVPYVNVWGTTPDKGYVQFFDSPRYSSGYAALFNVPSYVVETHMLKPYKERTLATYGFLKHAVKFLESNGEALNLAKKQQFSLDSMATALPVNWEADMTQADTLLFKGYEGVMKKSEVSGFSRLFYDRTKPYEKAIPYYNALKVTEVATIPNYYVIPMGWSKIVDYLKQNNIKVKQFKRDQALKVKVTYIDEYETVKTPYESHYLHYNIKTSTREEEVKVRKGDYIVKTNQPFVRFIIETLTPSAKDSYFAWNFFDAILQQKEHFSAYVFEDKAKQYLDEDPELKKAFDEALKKDASLRKNGYKQLEFIYDQTNHKEKSFMRYPIYSVYTEK
ncbi:M14 family metallopeptidase [Flammeovirga agarivorans]|uniref:M14 family metallopeptidase n=1 Tax=Flammeovirga agarivorans TaxID=2726742 RepID=UPI00293B8FDB|nr:M14 family metallopeptidase [Flammeovirga agarivorans]